MLDTVDFFDIIFYMDIIRKIGNIQGFDVDLMTFDEVINKIFFHIENNINAHVVTINPEIIQSAKKKPELKKIINEAEIITPDGVGIKIALKLKGINQNQVTGVDLSLKMLELCTEKNIPVALIGAKQEVLDLAIKNIKEKNPNINLVYSHNGYFSDNKEILDELKKTGAKFVLCAMGSPKQEYFIYEAKKVMQGSVMIGVGGTFDVISGTVKLAPEIFRRLGLEWFYRTVKQPERLKRIFPALPIFFFQSIIDSIVSKDKN